MTDEDFIKECKLRAQREILRSTSGEEYDAELMHLLSKLSVRMELIAQGIDPDEEVDFTGKKPE